MTVEKTVELLSKMLGLRVKSSKPKRRRQRRSN